ncbi:MAG: hypothetical protein H7144_12100 [Burkholderiales bacterium]|nr:hypothetical protein [Phycisphaerae bacterium]
MSEKSLREKYGGKLAKAINRAIRAELPDGNAALDKLTKLAGPAAYSGWATPDGKPTKEAAAYSRHKREIVDKLEAQIRKKWGVAAIETPSDAAKRTKAPPRARAPGRSKRGDPKTGGRARQNG